MQRSVGPAGGGLHALRELVAACLCAPAAGPLAAPAAYDPGYLWMSPYRSDRAGGGQRPGLTRGGGGGASDAAGDGGDSAQDAERQRISALVTLAQRGDGEAFAQIYEIYVSQVYRYLYYRCGSHAQAEDLTSETFLRALKRLETFHWNGTDIGAWFITIARNLVADHVKSARFRLEVSTADMLDADRGDGGIEDQVMSQLDNAALVEALRKLKPEQQECVVLRFFQGLNVAETALAMNRTPGAIKQLQLRAVRSLAALLPESAERMP